MEFPFNINHLLEYEVTKLDKNLTPFRKNADGYDRNALRVQLNTVIDKMGDASAKAQALHGTITTGRKLELSDHILYIMKDEEANGGHGACVGLLKVGHKKLFVYDRHGGQHEMEPMCVLDFYVHESRQRMGCGKMLFEHMLRDLYVKPQHCAIDKPSYKFSQFLQKHYNLKAVIPQVNNFVVFDGFFNSRPDSNNNKRSRFSNRTPASYNEDIIVRNGNRVPSSQYNSRQRVNNRPPSGGYRGNSRPPSGKYYGNSRPASGHMSSRSNNPRQVAEELNVAPRMNSDSEGQTNIDRSLHLVLQSLYPSHTNRALGAGANMYSRHADTELSNDNTDARVGARAASRTQADSRSLSQNRNQNSSEVVTVRPNSPPALQRDGPPKSYTDGFNLHQDYQGRSGHLKINNNESKISSLPSINKPQNAISNTPYAERFSPWRAVTNWNVHGLQNNNHQSIGARHYSHTRLW